MTGASGFIGSHLTNSLSEKRYNVSCLVRKTSDCSDIEALPNVEIVKGDITDKNSILRALKGCNSVVHLAASTSEKASDLRKSEYVNVDGAKKLIEACEQLKIDRVIVISTQSTKRRKKGQYAKTKSAADDLFLSSNLDVTILKPALVYGWGSKGLFAKIQKLAKSLPVIPIISTGNYKMQPTHVDDLNSAIISCLEKDATKNSIYDIAGGTRLTFKSFIDTVCEKKKRKIYVPFWLTYSGLSILSLFVKNPPVTKDNVLGLVQETEVDLSHAKRDFGYSPKNLTDGLRASRNIKTRHDEKRIGVVGFGKMGVVHASLINQISGARVVGVVDNNTKMETYSKSIGVAAPFFTDIKEMTREAKPDAVFLCVPPSANKDLVKFCASNDLAVFAEKPLADNLKNAKKIVSTVEKFGVENSVGYMLAFSPTFQKAQSLLKDIGNIERFEASALVSQVFGKQKGWRTAKSIAGGGCVAVHGSHLIYLLNNLLGRASKIRATLSNPHSKEVEDMAEIQAIYGKKRGKIFISWSEPGHQTLDINIKLYGTKGTLEVTNNLVELQTKNKKRKIYKSELEDLSEFDIGGDGYYMQDVEFIKALNKEKSRHITMREGLEVQKVVDAIYRSAKRGKEVLI